MEALHALILLGVEIMKEEFTIFGYTFSFWNIFIYSAVVDAAAWAVWRFVLND